MIAHAQDLPGCSVTPAPRSEIKQFSVARVGDEEVLFIPVVFHVVSSGVQQNVSDEQIYSQLAVINEDYNRLNADTVNTLPLFRAVAANVRIQFFLAESNGGFGITRTTTQHGPFTNDDLHLTSKGGRDGWNTDRYLNVWVANLAPGLVGYGSSPGSESFKDGVAVHYKFFGRGGDAQPPFHLGRTLTHEIGHWLGLDHPWGNGGCTSDDGLADTPPQSGPTSGCSLTQTSCGSLSMAQNFMNTSNDACMNLFTKQQKDQMRSTLVSRRPNAYTTSIVTGVPPAHESRDIIVYPNPLVQSSQANLRIPFSGTTSLTITDLFGKQLRQLDLSQEQSDIDIDLSGIPNGVYIARAESKYGTISTKIYLMITR